MMRREINRNYNTSEIPEIKETETKAESETKIETSKPINVGVHVKYQDKEYVVMSLKDNDEIFIGMDDETYTVNKSDVKVIR